MTVKLKKGDKVRVLNNDKWGHCYTIGSEVTVLKEVGTDKYDFLGGTGWCSDLIQVMHPSEYEVIEQPQKETQVSKEAKEQGKLLYVVTNTAHNGVIASTHDRDLAREIKADLGGKKKGYVIITHAPVKEIR